MGTHQGRLELTWTDKDKTLLSAGDGRYDYTFVDPSDYRAAEVRLLDEVDKVEAPTPAGRPTELPEPTTNNLLITGDAMHVLDALAKTPAYAEQYLGQVKLVYIDPPFNTGQAFANYEDNIEHSVWLTMLRDRLKQIRPLLSDDGSIWVHLDDVEVHRCRAVMDEEFGASNFIATVIWQKADSPRNSARHFSVDQDYILIYAKNADTWRPNKLPRTASADADYRNPDNDPRGPWSQGDPFANKPYKLGQYEVTGPSGNRFGPPPGRYWRISEEKFKELDRDGRIHWRGGGDARPRIKRFLSEVSDLIPRTVWDQKNVGSTGEGSREVRRLFPDVPVFATPKPERLLQQILTLATSPGDIVLDCYAGSGTTAAVAHKMGRRWVTSELLSSTVASFTKPRLLAVVKGDDDGGISKVPQRVAVDGLPEGMTPLEAQEFNRLLNRATSDNESLSSDALKALRKLTKTKDEVTQIWHGGGGFSHLKVSSSMFEDVNGQPFLAEWVAGDAMERAVAAQLGFRLESASPFCGKKGRMLLCVVDGVVDDDVVRAVVSRLGEGERVTLVGKAVTPQAPVLLKELSSGSLIRKAPRDLLRRGVLR